MNKKAKQNWLLFVIIGVVLMFALVYFSMDKIEKQRPQPADITKQEEGTPYVRLRDEEGNEGEMREEFYKVAGVIGSMIRGITSVSCFEDIDCINSCGGDNFCLNNIECYEQACTYTNIADIALDARATNTGQSNLDITLDSVSDGDAGTSVFETSHNANVGTTVQVNAGMTHTFMGNWFSLLDYEGKTTTFTVRMHAVDLYSGQRYPVSGTLDSNVELVISPDPSGGFSIQISQLPGI